MSFTVVNKDIIKKWIIEKGYDLNKYPEIQIKILIELIICGPQLRHQLVERLQKPRTTIYNHLEQLIKKGWVLKYNGRSKKRGRPRVYFKASVDERGKQIEGF